MAVLKRRSTTADTIKLYEDVFPLTFRESDTAAIVAQDQHTSLMLRLSRYGLITTSAAQMLFSVLGILMDGLVPGWENVINTVQLAILVIIGVGVVTTIVFRRKVGARRFEEEWCRSRAVAEQIRSNTWCYMMGVSPYENPTGNASANQAADDLFRATIGHIRSVWKQDAAREAPIESDSAGAYEITPVMNEVRTQTSWRERAEIYCASRVNEQRRWFNKKSKTNADKNRAWKRWRILFEVLALVFLLGGGAFKIICQWPACGMLPGHLVRLCMAFLWPTLTIIACMIAWVEYKRYAGLARTYGQYAEILGAIEDRLRLCIDRNEGPTHFSAIVKECEDVLTRENRLWFVRHGIDMPDLKGPLPPQTVSGEIWQHYAPRPLDVSHVSVPPDLELLTEKLAENAHDTWAVMRLEEGWTYGPERRDDRKQNPCLVPYDDLPDSEKEYDRQSAIQTIKAVLALGYTIASPNDNAPTVRE